MVASAVLVVEVTTSLLDALAGAQVHARSLAPLGRAGTVATTAAEMELIPCSSARAAVNACCALEPAAIVTDLSLPDEDGLWLASAVRAQPTGVAATPIVMVATARDPGTRLRALRGGVDVFLTRPLQAGELAAQVRALVQMASRIRTRRSSSSSAAMRAVTQTAPAAAGGSAALMGDLGRISVATVLSALELERRSGAVALRAAEGDADLELELAGGVLVGGRTGAARLSPLEALRAALGWKGKRFEFTPSEDRRAPAGSKALGTLILAALAHADAPAGAPSSRAAASGAPAHKRASPAAGPSRDGR